MIEILYRKGTRTMKFKILAAIAVGFGSMSMASAQAADFGGNCCADLEERIAELEATTARKGNRKVSLTIYGRVNQALLFWDDGSESNTYVVNNKTATTLVGFEGAARITNEFSAGYRLEVEFASANSDFVDQGNFQGPTRRFLGFGDESGPRNGMFIRHSNWWIEHKKLGRFTMGQQSNSTDNIAEMDLSRTSAVSLSSVETWNEGFSIRSDNNGDPLRIAGLLTAAFGLGGNNASIIGSLWRGNFDGGRGNLIRYDSPALAGFVLSADWGEDDDWAVALRYAGEFGQFRVRAGIGYHDGKILDTDNIIALLGGENSVVDHQEVVGSLALLHQPTGLYFSVAGGSREWDTIPGSAIQILDDKYFYVKGGILKRWNSLGDTSIYGEYYKIWDVGLQTPMPLTTALFNEEAETFGFGIVQHVDAAAMELYLAYRHYKADDITDVNTFQDHDLRYDMVMGGAKINF